jgi:phage RecT family recombinase
MGNGAQTTAIAVTDEVIVQKIAAWSSEHLYPFYHGTNFDAWKADVALAIAQSEKLRGCLNNTMDAIKLARALQLNAASGLSLNPQHGQAALVVYNSKKNGLVVNHIVMKNGLIKKAMDTRKVVKVESGTIYENDEFKVKKSSRGDEYEWTPALRDRGKPAAYFACITLTGGNTAVEYWTHKQVLEHAVKYGQGKKWDNAKGCYTDEFESESAWGKSFNGMAEKTVIRAAFNNLYLPELDEIFAEEERQAEEIRDVTEEPQQGRGTGAADLAADLAAREEAPPAQAQAVEPQAATAQVGAAQAAESKPADDALF